MLQSIVSCFSASKLFDNEILTVLEVVSSLVHSDHNVINAHEESEENVKAGRHHALKKRKLGLRF